MSWKKLGQILPGEHYHTLCSSTILTLNYESAEEIVEACSKYVDLPAAYVVCGSDVLIWESEEAARKALAAVGVKPTGCNYIPAIYKGEVWEGKLFPNGTFVPLVKMPPVSDPDQLLHV